MKNHDKLGVAVLVLAAGVWGLAQTHVRIVGFSLVQKGVEMSPPPAPGKARVWAPAQAKTPVVEGYAVRTDADAHAEVSLECDSELRLAPSSEFSFSQLGLTKAGVPVTTVELAKGAAAFSLRRADTKQFKVALPGGDSIAAPNQNVRFLVKVGPESAAAVEVVDGKATVQVGSRSFKLSKNNVLAWSAAAAPQRRKAGQLDAFAQWSHQRDVGFDRSLTAARMEAYNQADQSWSNMKPNARYTPSGSGSSKNPLVNAAAQRPQPGQAHEVVTYNDTARNPLAGGRRLAPCATY